MEEHKNTRVLRTWLNIYKELEKEVGELQRVIARIGDEDERSTAVARLLKKQLDVRQKELIDLECKELAEV